MKKFVSLLTLILIIVLGTLYAQKTKQTDSMSNNRNIIQNEPDINLFTAMPIDNLKSNRRTDLMITSVNLMQLESMLKYMNKPLRNGMTNYLITMQKNNVRVNKILSTQIVW